jgi:shikimate 5-dehydrogenase
MTVNQPTARQMLERAPARGGERALDGNQMFVHVGLEDGACFRRHG